jgi:hypothetical protein
MDAGAVDLLWFVTACELLFGKCVSSVSHGHRLAHIGGVRKFNRLWRSRKDMYALPSRSDIEKAPRNRVSAEL